MVEVTLRRAMLLAAAVLAAPRPFAAQPAPWPADGAARLVAAATAQTAHTVRYDGAYRRIPYPLGDVPSDIGVCSDVVVRAYRALGIDLQQRVHEDMRAAFSAYPRAWGLARPDPNIDHRRVPNLRTFFQRRGTSRPLVVHNIGRGPEIEDTLFAFPITGHYRYRGE